MIPTTNQSPMRAWINFSLRSLILLPLLAQLASAQAPHDTSARQNLLFGWEALPRLVERCMSSAECQGSDSELLSMLREAQLRPNHLQPEFIFHYDAASEFCRQSRDVYTTSRVWFSAIQVCDPRLYHPQTQAPLWSPEVSLIEMSELALLKSSQADQNIISNLATRMAELSGVRVQLQVPGIGALSGLRVLTLEDRDSADVLLSSLLAPDWKHDILEMAHKDNACAAFGAETLQVSLKRPRWVDASLDELGSGFAVGLADAVVDCKSVEKTFVLKGSFRWRLDFRLKASLRYTDLVLDTGFDKLRPVSPNP